MCAWRWIFPCRTHLTGNRCTERHRKQAEINSLWGLTVEMHCCHTHMSLSQGVRRSRPASSSSSSFHLPSSFFLLLLCLVKEKSFLYWDSKTNIRLLSASREKANIHWRTEWLRSFWVWRAKSQPSWCSTAFFLVYLVIVHPVQATLKSSRLSRVFVQAKFKLRVSNRKQYLRLSCSSMTQNTVCMHFCSSFKIKRKEMLGTVWRTTEAEHIQLTVTDAIPAPCYL